MTNTNHHAWLKNYKVSVTKESGKLSVAVEKKQPTQAMLVVPEPQKPPKKPWTADEVIFVVTVIGVLVVVALRYGWIKKLAYPWTRW